MSNRLRILSLPVLGLTLVAAATLAGPPALFTERSADPLTRLTGLAGTWAVLDGAGEATGGRARFEVVAGGAAVLEQLELGAGQDSVTLYLRDGRDVVATHASPRGPSSRLAVACTPDGALVMTATANSAPRPGELREARYARLGAARVEIEWLVAGAEDAASPVRLTLGRVEDAGALAKQVAGMRSDLDALQRQLERLRDTDVDLTESSGAHRTLRELRTFPLDDGWTVVGTPLRLLMHEQTRRFATTYASDGDAGMTVAHFPFVAGQDAQASFAVLGGHAYVAVVQEGNAPPRRIRDIPAFAQALEAGEYGPIVERVKGGRWSDLPRSFEWDLSRFAGQALRLYIVDAVTDHYGQIAVSEFRITSDPGRGR